jgi:hypothetical protein
MKKEQLQKILKPLIKECIKEVIFEEGVLSNIIKEVAVGIGSQQTIVESVQEPSQDFSRQRVELQEEARAAMQEKKRRLEESMGGGFSGIFDSTEPLSSGGSVQKEGSAQSPLSAYAPNDAGVDINGLMNIAGGHNWKKMI